MEGKCYSLWASGDTENGGLLGVALTPTRDGRDASRFILRVPDVHERADSADGQRAGCGMVSVSAQQVRRALEAGDVREVERSGAAK